MPAYAFAHLRTVDLNADVLRYLDEIDATLEPYGGRFLVHGTTPEVVEGPLEGDIVVIEFPDATRAREWYESDAYQRILPLRTENSDSATAILAGGPAGYGAADLAASLRQAATAGGS